MDLGLDDTNYGYQYQADSRMSLLQTAHHTNKTLVELSDRSKDDDSQFSTPPFHQNPDRVPKCSQIDGERVPESHYVFPELTELGNGQQR